MPQNYLQSTVLLVALAVTSVVASAQESVRHEDVTVIQNGKTVMYKFRDAQGNIVVQDQPPLGYLNPVRKAPAETAPVVVAPAAPAIVPASAPPVASLPAYVPKLLAVLAMVLFGAGLFVFFRGRVARALRETKLERILRQCGLPVFHDVVLPGNKAADFSIDHVIQTPTGLLVLDVVQLPGALSGTEDQPLWTHTTSAGVEKIANPLLHNTDAVAAVSQLAGNVSVTGRVVVDGKVSFPHGAPKEAMSVQTLQRFLPRMNAANTPGRELAGAWRTLMRYPRRNKAPVHARRPGIAGWLDHHRQAAGAGALMALSVTSAVAAAVIAL